MDSGIGEIEGALLTKVVLELAMQSAGDEEAGPELVVACVDRDVDG